MAYGLTPGGFSRPSFQAIRSQMETDTRADTAFGPEAVVQGGVWGRLIDVLSERYGLLWEGLQGVYNARTRKGAEGVALDDLASLTGTTRQPALKSVVSLTVYGVPGTVVPAGFTARTASTNARFRTVAAATILPGGSVSGVRAENEVYGPVAAVAGTLNQVVTAFAGVTGVNNPEDAQLGAWVESDASLRLRQQEEVRASGSGSPDAMRAQVLKVGDGTNNPVTACTIFENLTPYTNADGVPGFAVEPVVQGGDDAAIALAVWRSKPAGTYTHGTTLVYVADAAGDLQPSRFSRPQEIAVYVALTLKRGPKWPTLAADVTALVNQVKAAVASYDDELELGDEVVHNYLFEYARSPAGKAVIAGVPVLTLGTTPGPTGTDNIYLSKRQRANLDTSRVTVTLV